MSTGGSETDGFGPEDAPHALTAALTVPLEQPADRAVRPPGPPETAGLVSAVAETGSGAHSAASGMWCDTFDADLLAVVPGAAEALGPAASVELRTYSRLTGGKINHPSCWNTNEGLAAFFWTAPQHQPIAGFVTNDPIATCTFLEAVRDEWVHSCTINVNGRIVWRPPTRKMERLMYDVRGWTVLAATDREDIRQSVRRSLERAAKRLTAVVGSGAR